MICIHWNFFFNYRDHFHHNVFRVFCGGGLYKEDRQENGTLHTGGGSCQPGLWVDVPHRHRERHHRGVPQEIDVREGLPVAGLVMILRGIFYVYLVMHETKENNQ